ncbi:MAG TPA: rod shape-determining protein RodA [Rhodospirillaceae bacterium]|nr:rod shape-determining protein RodA [Rhodospirillaceae bacterium]
MNLHLKPEILLPQKITELPWLFMIMIAITGGIGVMAQYSAGQGGWEVYAFRHLMVFMFGYGLALLLAMIDLRHWARGAYIIFGVMLVLIVAVDLVGMMGKGAQRWIALGPLQLQPSEFMKLAVILALANYYANVSEYDLGNPRFLLPPLLIIAIPAIFILRQPNLGTALIVITLGCAMSFAAGVRIWKFLAMAGTALAAIPVIWHFMHDYQRKRVMTFLDPESDPLGAGYHITQAKIALGSGGLTGKGFLEGTQAHLQFLPEAQTDFIFSLLGEEWGFIGAAFFILMYFTLIVLIFRISLNARSLFGRLVAVGVGFNLFMYFMINIGMVMGLLPVVGIPLPLISMGGSAMLATMLGFGAVLAVAVHSEQRV